MAIPSSTPWRFEVSWTMKAIYAMRYGMFSGGVAIALGVAERAVTGRTPLLGLLAGLGIGLVLFRGQLRAFQLPALALGRDHLHFARRGAAVRVPWSNLKSASPRGRQVVVQLHQPGLRPDGTAGASFQLVARDFGLGPGALAGLLEGYLPPARRERLPADGEVARALGIAGG